MAGLYLNCALCGRRQAGGLLSSAAWGRVEQASANGATRAAELCACPACVERHPDWREQLVQRVQTT
jgi:hypothetical protein